MKILFLLFSYLFGAIPTGYVFFWISDKKDIRNFGSGSTGATNLLRVKGWKLALPVIVIDILKGVVPVFLALKLFSDLRVVVLAGFLVVFGHCFPVYLKFKGGKGVATTTGVFVTLAFKPCLISVAIFIIIIAISRYVSLGSLLSVLSYPFLIIIFNKGEEILFLSIAVFILIAARHSGNIKRLMQGTERKSGEKAK
jgi:glycerol-3-phosphate acyltransferase PlsY